MGFCKNRLWGRPLGIASLSPDKLDNSTILITSGQFGLNKLLTLLCIRLNKVVQWRKHPWWLFNTFFNPFFKTFGMSTSILHLSSLAGTSLKTEGAAVVAVRVLTSTTSRTWKVLQFLQKCWDRRTCKPVDLTNWLKFHLMLVGQSHI